MTNRKPPLDQSQRARCFLIGATFFWGATFPLLRGLQMAQQTRHAHVPDAVLACADVSVRFGLAALLLLPFYLRVLGRITKLEWSQGIGLALFGGGGLFLQTLGLVWTDATISAFLTQLYTLIVPIIVALRDRRRPGLRIAVACAMVLAGAALLSPGLLRHFVLGPGEWITLLSTGFFAGQIVWVERPVYASNRTGVVTLIMFSLIALIFVVAYPFLGGTLGTSARLFDTPAICGLTIFLVLFCTILTFLVMNTWQRFISATEAGLIYCLEPVIATALCAFVPGWISRLAGINYANENLRWGLLAGGSLILGASVLAQKEPHRN